MPLAGFFVICVLLGLSWFLVKSKIILGTTLAIILFGYFVAFGFNGIYLTVVLISLGAFFYGASQAIDERDVRIKVRVSKILKVGLPSLLTGLILLTVTAYYFSPMSMTEFEIPRPLFDVIMKAVPLPSMRGDLNSLLSDLNLEGLNLEDLDMENLEIDRTEMENALQILPSQMSDDDMYNMLNQIIHDYLEPYKKYFAVGVAVGIFFMLKTLSVPFMWLAIFFSWLIFKLLVFLGAIRIQEKSVLQEVIE